jgi:hypothetical protein
MLSCTHSSPHSPHSLSLSAVPSTKNQLPTPNFFAQDCDSDHEDGPICSLLLQIRISEPAPHLGNNPTVSPSSNDSLDSKDSPVTEQPDQQFDVIKKHAYTLEDISMSSTQHENCKK